MAMTSSQISKGLGLVLVMFQYEYQDRDGALISIKPNERYILLAKTNDHWWQVRRDNNSKPFYIPAKYVKELPPDVPSLLDFGGLPDPEPMPLPATTSVPVPVPVPIPKTLEEPSWTKTKPGDEVMIRLRPDASTGYRKTENRMSTFGVLLDYQDLSPLVMPTPCHSSTSPAGPAETMTTTSSRITNVADDGKKHLSGFLDEHRDSGKHRAPSFSPADPISTPRPQTQPIHVETPVVPSHNDVHSPSLPSTIRHDNQDPLIEQKEEEVEEEEEEEMNMEESTEEEESQKDEDSNHIYESIQDLNLDVEALVGGRLSPGCPPEPAPAPPPTQDSSSPNPNSPIYANVSSLKKPSVPQMIVSGASSPPPPDHAPCVPNHSPLSSVSSTGMISPASPLSPQDGWQGSCDWEQLVDQVSGRVYYYNPTSRATSWAVPESPPGFTAGRSRDDGPPPLPEEDYPVDVLDNNNAAFSQNPQQHLIPRAQLNLKDENGSKLRLQELPSLPPRLMGNGVSEEGSVVQVTNWRHSVAEDTFARTHRRNVSDFSEVLTRRHSPDSPQHSDGLRLKRNLSSRSTGSHHLHGHLLEKAGIINKTKVADCGKKIRKNWSQSWTVLHGGILTFHKDPKSAPTGNATKSSQIVPEYTVELRGASVGWASKDKSSKKNVLEMKTRQGCEYLMQYDTESIISDWLKVIQDTIRQLDQEHLSEDEDEASSDKEDKDRKRTSSRTSSGAADSEQRRVRTKLRRFLQRRPTLQSVKEKGYIRDNVFGCHLDTLCHRENTTIPKFVEKCVKVVEKRGLDVDGIYRVSGNLAVIQKLRHKADHEEELDLEDGQWEEIHVITGALKLFLRELPEPLFPFSCFDKFIAAIQLPDYSLRLSYMQDLVRALPLPNHHTMELLFKHLCRVIEHKDSNRMSVQSVAIVFGPTLLRPQIESANMTIHMVFQSQIVELMLNEFEKIFPQGQGEPLGAPMGPTRTL